MQCNFVVDSNGAGAIQRMDKNAAIIGKFTLFIYSKISRGGKHPARGGECPPPAPKKNPA